MDASDVTFPPDIRVLLVDDYPAVREGLALLLAPEGIDVCAEAGGLAEAVAQADKSGPTWRLSTSRSTGENGLTLIAHLRQCDIPVLVYTMHYDARRVEQALAAGALGYVTKRALPRVLVEGIREVSAGRHFVSPDAAAALAEHVTSSRAEDALAKLSPHERKIYDLMGRVADTFEIAAALRVSSHTVESYYERIKAKLGVNAMHELRRHAIEHFPRQEP